MSGSIQCSCGQYNSVSLRDCIEGTNCYECNRHIPSPMSDSECILALLDKIEELESSHNTLANVLDKILERIIKLIHLAISHGGS